MILYIDSNTLELLVFATRVKDKFNVDIDTAPDCKVAIVNLTRKLLKSCSCLDRAYRLIIIHLGSNGLMGLTYLQKIASLLQQVKN